MEVTSGPKKVMSVALRHTRSIKVISNLTKQLYRQALSVARDLRNRQKVEKSGHRPT